MVNDWLRQQRLAAGALTYVAARRFGPGCVGLGVGPPKAASTAVIIEDEQTDRGRKVSVKALTVDPMNEPRHRSALSRSDFLERKPKGLLQTHAGVMVAKLDVFHDNKGFPAWVFGAPRWQRSAGQKAPSSDGQRGGQKSPGGLGIHRGQTPMTTQGVSAETLRPPSWHTSSFGASALLLDHLAEPLHAFVANEWPGGAVRGPIEAYFAARAREATPA
jgi:hypothetical protein